MQVAFGQPAEGPSRRLGRLCTLRPNPRHRSNRPVAEARVHRCQLVPQAFGAVIALHERTSSTALYQKLPAGDREKPYLDASLWRSPRTTSLQSAKCFALPRLCSINGRIGEVRLEMRAMCSPIFWLLPLFLSIAYADVLLTRFCGHLAAKARTLVLRSAQCYRDWPLGKERFSRSILSACSLTLIPQRIWNRWSF